MEVFVLIEPSEYHKDYVGCYLHPEDCLEDPVFKRELKWSGVNPQKIDFREADNKIEIIILSNGKHWTWHMYLLKVIL